MNPLDVPCTVCNARVNQRCWRPQSLFQKQYPKGKEPFHEERIDLAAFETKQREIVKELA